MCKFRSRNFWKFQKHTRISVEKFPKIIRTFRAQNVCKCSKNARFSVSKFLHFPKTVTIREISAEKFLQYYLFPNIANFCREISEPPKFHKSWSQIFEIKKCVNVGTENCEFFENVQVLGLRCFSLKNARIFVEKVPNSAGLEVLFFENLVCTFRSRNSWNFKKWFQISQISL